MNSWRTYLSASFHPTPSVGRVDTSLRYTDILFGLVIRELFQRLQHWTSIQNIVRAQLVVGTILVLGSWIGYRRSLNRSAYEVKFFNIPFFRFVTDQAMLILYFRISTLTPVDLHSAISPDIAQSTLTAVLIVFVLYAVWDALGLWEGLATKPDGTPRYSVVDEDKREPTGKRKTPDLIGCTITLSFLAALFVVWMRSATDDVLWDLWVVAVLLLLYRWVKEVRTTCR